MSSRRNLGLNLKKNRHSLKTIEHSENVKPIPETQVNAQEDQTENVPTDVDEGVSLEAISGIPLPTPALFIACIVIK